MFSAADQVAARQQLEAISARRQAQLTEQWPAERRESLTTRLLMQRTGLHNRVTLNGEVTYLNLRT